MESKILVIFIVGISIFILNAESASRVDPLVETKIGLIRGLRASDGEYAMFLGIPYAYVNTSNPFGPSIPHAGFHETFEAVDDSAECPQNSRSGPIGTLDCLHLNIHVPNIASSTNSLPVMVWIHGGGFQVGTAGRKDQTFTYLVQHEVIVVSLNYRLGPYGFMCLDTPEVPGNQGLKDQHLALKWIKNNIEAFGGDADKITIFGESAGGVSVDLQLFYSDENLFNKVIIQSGSALCPWGLLDSDSTTALRLAEYLGLKTNDLEEAIAFLTKIDPELVIAASSEMNFIFRPCVEKAFDGVDRFIDEHPLNVNVPRVKNIPILAGYNNDEALTFVIPRSPKEQKSLILDNIIEFLVFKDEEIPEAEELIRHFYIGDEEVNESTIKSMVDFYSDFTFNHPMSRSVKQHLENGAVAIYQYLFSYNGARNIGKLGMNITIGGAAHADELGYLFGPLFEGDVPTPEDQVIIDRMTKLWTNFAKYGNPTPETSDLLPVAWPPLNKETVPYMNIDSKITVESRPFHARHAFWDLFYKHYNKGQRGYRDEEDCLNIM